MGREEKRSEAEPVLKVPDFGVYTVVRSLQTVQGGKVSKLFHGILLRENSIRVGKVFKDYLYPNHKGAGAKNKQNQQIEAGNVSFILVYVAWSTVPNNVLFILLDMVCRPQ